MPLAPGSRFGPYEILSAIGAGGMGEVYRARDTRLNRDVAVKVLLPIVATDPDRLARFRREAQVLASLNHPNIAHIHGVEEADGVTALILELVEGEDLAERIRRGPIPLDEALPIARQIAEALEAAHEQGIIHRDLKPANIKIRSDGTVKVLDFGLAKATDAAGTSAVNAMNSPTLSVHATQGGLILGTAAYMSPEQAAGKPLDKRTDLWSFGVVVLEMLTGKPVFSGETVAHVLAEILKSEPELRHLPMEAPAPLRRMLQRCLEKNRKRRLADAADARLEIEDAETAAHAGAAAAASPRPAPRSALSRALMWTWAAATVAIVAAWLLQWAPWRGHEAPRNAMLKFIPLSFDQGGQTAAVWSPDGKAVAYGARQNAAEPYQLYVRYLDSPIATQITHLDTGAVPREWITTGRIVFASPRARTPVTFWTVSPLGGEPEPLPGASTATMTITRDGSTAAWLQRSDDGAPGMWTSSPPGTPPKRYEPDPFAVRGMVGMPTMTFSPDGRKILFFRSTRDGEQAWLIPYPANPATPPRRVLESLRAFSGSSQFSWLPDSRRVIVSTTTGADSFQLFVADTVSGAVAPLSSSTRPQRSPSVSPDGTKLTFLEQLTDYDLVSLDLTTGVPTPVLTTQRREAMPMWAAKEAALVYATDRNGAWEIWLRKPGQPDRPLVTPRDFTDTTRWFMGPTLSPDATRIIYTRNSDDGGPQLWMSAVAGGAPVRLVKSAGADEFAGGWSPDGRWFVYLSSHEGSESVNKVKTTGGAEPEVLKATSRRGGVSWVPAWSPAGDWILYADGVTAKLISPDGKTTRDFPASPAAAYAFSADGRTVYGIRASARASAELFSMPVTGGPEKIIATIDAALLPASPLNPSLHLSLSPDGKTLMFATVRTTANLWLVQGLDAFTR